MPQPAATPQTPEGLSPVAMTQPPLEAVIANPPAPTVLLSALPTEAAAPVANEPVPAVTSAAAMLPVFPADPALQSLLQQLCTSQQTIGQKFHLLYIPADDSPSVETFETCPQLVTRIIKLLGQPCFLYAFMGHYLPMTPGPLRHLRTPFGYMPLFVMPTASAMQPADGWAGATPRPEVRAMQIDAENREMPPGEVDLQLLSVGTPHPTAAEEPQFPGALPSAAVGNPRPPVTEQPQFPGALSSAAGNPHPSTLVDVTPMFPAEPPPAG